MKTLAIELRKEKLSRPGGKCPKRRSEFDPIADIENAGIITAGYGSAGISAGGAVWIPAFSRSLRR